MADKGHSLHVTNYKPGETVTFEIVLLKGFVTNNNCTNCEENIIINNEKYPLGPKNTFKALVRMKEHFNCVMLNYCCQSKTFELIYEMPKNRRRLVTPLYVIFKGHDGSFQNSSTKSNNSSTAINKLHLNCLLIQTILAEKLYETHKKHITFHLTPPKLFHSNLSIDNMQQLESRLLFEALALDIKRSEEGSSNVKYIAFLSGTEYKGELYKPGMVYEDLVKITKQYIALGCGDLAVFHTASLYSWPEKLEDVIQAFCNQTRINRTELLDDSNYRGTYGACYSTTLGAVLHELCHAFNLGHADVGIMSRGFDDVRDIFLVDSVDAIEMDRRIGIRGITDSTSLHRSGAQILRYNKWFLTDERDLPYVITFDALHNVIRSSWGIKVIEIRSGDEEMMTHHWIYSVARMNIKLPLIDLKQKSKLYAQDSKGNFILKNMN